jgi:8-oxo-dGTP diphosphatase
MQKHTSSPTTSLSTYFLVGEITASQIAAIRFGDEGQFWQMMKQDDFLAHPKGITHLQKKLADYLNARNSGYGQP